ASGGLEHLVDYCRHLPVASDLPPVPGPGWLCRQLLYGVTVWLPVRAHRQTPALLGGTLHARRGYLCWLPVGSNNLAGTVWPARVATSACVTARQPDACALLDARVVRPGLGSEPPR